MSKDSRQARQVLIPGRNKAIPHPWQVPLAIARGEILPEHEEAAYNEVAEGVQHAMRDRSTWRSRTGRNPVRNPGRIHRLRKNGRLRRELR